MPRSAALSFIKLFMCQPQDSGPTRKSNQRGNRFTVCMLHFEMIEVKSSWQKSRIILRDKILSYRRSSKTKS